MTAARRGALMREPAWAGARVVVVSQGTTGTHAAFHALAALGLPTAHWVGDRVAQDAASSFEPEPPQGYAQATRAARLAVPDAWWPRGTRKPLQPAG